VVCHVCSAWFNSSLGAVTDKHIIEIIDTIFDRTHMTANNNNDNNITNIDNTNINTDVNNLQAHFHNNTKLTDLYHTTSRLIGMIYHQFDK
jgi:hypothetical protein